MTNFSSADSVVGSRPIQKTRQRSAWITIALHGLFDSVGDQVQSARLHTKNACKNRLCA